MNLDKEILEFGRLQTAVWTKKNSSFNKGKLQFEQRKTGANE